VAKSKVKELPVRVSPLVPSGNEFIVDCADLRLQERKNLTAIQVLAYAGQYETSAAAIGKALGIECPVVPGICNSDGHLQLAWNGPNSWMIIASDAESGHRPGKLQETLKKAVGEQAAIIDQSHGRSGLRLSGKHARAVMAKNCAIDLHPRAFKAGNCALTSVAHMSTLVIQLDDTPSYDLFVARSLARSFAHAIEHACAEYAA
jgi:sarcosine oxidase subunit gamma